MGCRKNKIKYTCVQRTNATCVFYDGYLPPYSDLLSEDCVTLEETTEEIYHLIDDIKENINLSGLGDNCLNYDEEEIGVIKVKEALLTHEAEICNLKAELNALQSLDCCDDITSWNIDTKCLEDECGTGFQSLKLLIQAIIDKLCTLETLLNP